MAERVSVPEVTGNNIDSTKILSEYQLNSADRMDEYDGLRYLDNRLERLYDRKDESILNEKVDERVELSEPILTSLEKAKEDLKNNRYESGIQAMIQAAGQQMDLAKADYYRVLNYREQMQLATDLDQRNDLSSEVRLAASRAVDGYQRAYRDLQTALALTSYHVSYPEAMAPYEEQIAKILSNPDVYALTNDGLVAEYHNRQPAGTVLPPPRSTEQQSGQEIGPATREISPETSSANVVTAEEIANQEVKKEPKLKAAAKGVYKYLINPFMPFGKSKIAYAAGIAAGGLAYGTGALAPPVRLALSAGSIFTAAGLEVWNIRKKGRAKSAEELADIEKKYKRANKYVRGFSSGLAATSLVNLANPNFFENAIQSETFQRIVEVGDKYTQNIESFTRFLPGSSVNNIGESITGDLGSDVSKGITNSLLEQQATYDAIQGAAEQAQSAAGVTEVGQAASSVGAESAVQAASTQAAEIAQQIPESATSSVLSQAAETAQQVSESGFHPNSLMGQLDNMQGAAKEIGNVFENSSPESWAGTAENTTYAVSGEWAGGAVQLDSVVTPNDNFEQIKEILSTRFPDLYESFSESLHDSLNIEVVGDATQGTSELSKIALKEQMLESAAEAGREASTHVGLSQTALELADSVPIEIEIGGSFEQTLQNLGVNPQELYNNRAAMTNIVFQNEQILHRINPAAVESFSEMVLQGGNVPLGEFSNSFKDTIPNADKHARTILLLLSGAWLANRIAKQNKKSHGPKPA